MDGTIAVQSTIPTKPIVKAMVSVMLAITAPIQQALIPLTVMAMAMWIAWINVHRSQHLGMAAARVHHPRTRFQSAEIASSKAVSNVSHQERQTLILALPYAHYLFVAMAIVRVASTSSVPLDIALPTVVFAAKPSVLQNTCN